MTSLPKVYVSFLFGMTVGATIYAIGIERGRAIEQPSADPPPVYQPSEPLPPPPLPQETEPSPEIETMEDVFFSLMRK